MAALQKLGGDYHLIQSQIADEVPLHGTVTVQRFTFSLGRLAQAHTNPQPFAASTSAVVVFTEVAIPYIEVSLRADFFHCLRSPQVGMAQFCLADVLLQNPRTSRAASRPSAPNATRPTHRCQHIPERAIHRLEYLAVWPTHIPKTWANRCCSTNCSKTNRKRPDRPPLALRKTAQADRRLQISLCTAAIGWQRRVPHPLWTD